MDLGLTQVCRVPYLVKAVAKHCEAVVAQLCNQALQQLQLLVRTHTYDQQPDRVKLVLQYTSSTVETVWQSARS